MVLWKNEDLKDYGIIVEKTPNITKGKKRISTYEIAGRNGVLVIDEGTYSEFVCSLECHFDTDNYSIEEIKEFLDGYGTLSLDGEKEYKAYIKNAIDFEKVMNFRKFMIQFGCNPIATDIEETVSIITGSGQTLNISDATANMYPTIIIKGSGNVSLTFNNRTFYLYNLVSTNEYTLDCENKEIVDKNGVNCSNLMKYDFPYLEKGENAITTTGTINSLIIKYKKSYL